MDNKDINFKAIGSCLLPHCFNGHAFLAYGDIVELKSPTYAAERNRITKNIEQWLKKECKEFFETKLYESNETLSDKEKKKVLKSTKRFNTKMKIKERIKKVING